MQGPTAFLSMFSTGAHSTTRDVFAFFLVLSLSLSAHFVKSYFHCLFRVLLKSPPFLDVRFIIFLFLHFKKKKKNFLVSCTCPRIDMLEARLAVLSRRAFRCLHICVTSVRSPLVEFKEHPYSSPMSDA